MKSLATKCLTLSMNRTENFSFTYLKSLTKQQMHGLSSNFTTLFVLIKILVNLIKGLRC